MPPSEIEKKLEVHQMHKAMHIVRIASLGLCLHYMQAKYQIQLDGVLAIVTTAFVYGISEVIEYETK